MSEKGSKSSWFVNQNPISTSYEQVLGAFSAIYIMGLFIPRKYYPKDLKVLHLIYVRKRFEK